MQLRNTPYGYGVVARFFHWVMFLLIGLTVMLALSMDDMPAADKALTERLHRTLGLLILVLLVLRFAWKITNPRPMDLPGPAWANRAAQVVHGLLYGIILLQAAAGILVVQARGEPVDAFGLQALPAFLTADPVTAQFWEKIHALNWLVLTVLVAGHVAAALYRHFADRGEVFRRMGPVWRSGSELPDETDRPEAGSPESGGYPRGASGTSRRTAGRV